MEDWLDFSETAYIEAHHILPLLSAYVNPRDFLARLVKKGELIRLKNGFFVIAKKIEKNPVPYPQIANLLYGPSYLSFEWALSYYGMIPEGVYRMTSVSLGKSKIFETPLGIFDYHGLSKARYAIGIDQKETSAGKFLIATAEKALSDLVHCKSSGLKSTKDLLVDLIEARRMEENVLKGLNKKMLKAISVAYRSRALGQLVEALNLL